MHLGHGRSTAKSLLKAQAENAWHDFLKWLFMWSSQWCLLKSRIWICKGEVLNAVWKPKPSELLCVACAESERSKLTVTL